MSGQFSVTFSGFSDVLIRANIHRGRRVVRPRPQPAGGFERSIIRGAVNAAAPVSPFASAMSRLMTLPLPTARFLGSFGSLPIRSPSPDFTVTEGVTVAGGAVVAFGGGGGLYYWNKRPDGELGLYGSLSIGMMSNVGVGGGVAFAFLAGSAPSVLAGDIIALEVDVGVSLATVGGQIFLTAPPVSLHPLAIGPGWSPEVVGIGFSVTVGYSVLPANYAVTASRTWIRPITP